MYSVKFKRCLKSLGSLKKSLPSPDSKPHLYCLLGVQPHTTAKGLPHPHLPTLCHWAWREAKNSSKKTPQPGPQLYTNQCCPGEPSLAGKLSQPAIRGALGFHSAQGSAMPGRSSLGANRPGSEEGGVLRDGCEEESPGPRVGVERLNRWESAHRPGREIFYAKAVPELVPVPAGTAT